MQMWRVVIPAGADSVEIKIVSNQDWIYEDAETFEIEIFTAWPESHEQSQLCQHDVIATPEGDEIPPWQPLPKTPPIMVRHAPEFISDTDANLNLNQPSPPVNNDKYTLYLDPETQSGGKVQGTRITAFNPLGRPVKYSIVGGDTYFEIDSDLGIIKTNKKLTSLHDFTTSCGHWSAPPS